MFERLAQGQGVASPLNEDHELEGSKTHTLHLSVRDYECDSGGGVNNAVYWNYFEHARFQYLREHLGWNVEELLKVHHIGFVVMRIEVDFRRSLIANQKFLIQSTLSRQAKRKFHFCQEIFLDAPQNSPVRKPLVKASVLCTAVNTLTERSETPQVLEDLLKDFPIVEDVAG